MARRLTPQQILFIDEYLKTSNATNSYIFAYYTSKGKPEPKKSIGNVNGSKLLSTHSIASEVARRLELKAKENKILNPQEVLEGICFIASADPAALIDEATNEPLPIHKIPKEVRLAITQIETTEFITEKSDGTETSRRTKTICRLAEKMPAYKVLQEVWGIGKNGNGLKEMFIDFLKASGLTVNINQTINNDNRQLINYNPAAIKPLPETDGSGATGQ